MNHISIDYSLDIETLKVNYFQDYKISGILNWMSSSYFSRYYCHNRSKKQKITGYYWTGFKVWNTGTLHSVSAQWVLTKEHSSLNYSDYLFHFFKFLYVVLYKQWLFYQVAGFYFVLPFSFLPFPHSGRL